MDNDIKLFDYVDVDKYRTELAVEGLLHGWRRYGKELEKKKTKYDTVISNSATLDKLGKAVKIIRKLSTLPNFLDLIIPVPDGFEGSMVEYINEVKKLSGTIVGDAERSLKTLEKELKSVIMGNSLTPYRVAELRDKYKAINDTYKGINSKYYPNGRTGQYDRKLKECFSNTEELIEYLHVVGYKNDLHDSKRITKTASQ